MRLIDGDELKDFFFSETSGTEEIIRDLMMQHNLDYANDVNEDEVMDFAKELLKKVCNIIDTEPTAYDIDKVVEELREWSANVTILELHNNELGEYEEECKRDVICTLNAIDIVKQGLKEQK